MDIKTINNHYKLLADHYPGMNITQLGLSVAMLGMIRSSLGHEDAAGTVENYIHSSELSPEVRQCVDFIEREILSLKKSKIDIDYWKFGNKGSFRRDSDLTGERRV